VAPRCEAYESESDIIAGKRKSARTTFIPLWPLNVYSIQFAAAGDAWVTPTCVSHCKMSDFEQRTPADPFQRASLSRYHAPSDKMI